VKKLGTRIKNARKALGLTAEQVAHKTNISTNTILKIERGTCGSMATIDPLIGFLEDNGKIILFNEDSVDLYDLDAKSKVLVRALIDVLRRDEG